MESRKAESNPSTKPTTVVHSWDFDGMLASGVYLEAMQERISMAAKANFGRGRSLNKNDYLAVADKVLDAYAELFFDKKFTGSVNQGAKHVMFVGSDRQDRSVDNTNGSVKGWDHFTTTMSAFPFYEALVERIKQRYGVDIVMDKLLLEDIYQGFPPGTTFDNQVETFYNLPRTTIKKIDAKLRGSEEQLVFDKEVTEARKDLRHIETALYNDHQKFMIMHTQMHYAHEKYGKGSAIVYDYVDDRKDLLTAAEHVQGENSALIPPGMVVSLEQFLPPEAEYNQMREEDKKPQHHERFGPYTARRIFSTGGEVDQQIFETVLSLHKQLPENPSLITPKNDSFAHVSDVMMAERGKTKAQQRQNQDGAVRDILNIVNLLDSAKSSGVAALRKVFDGRSRNEHPEKVLEKLQKNAEQHAAKPISGKGLFQEISDPFHKLLQAIKDLNIKNPDRTVLQNLHHEYDQKYATKESNRPSQGSGKAQK